MHDLQKDWPAYALLILVATTMITVSRLPWERWALRMIEDWAETNGFRVLDVEGCPFGLFERFLRGADSMEQVYRVWLIDDQGQQAQCVALVDPCFKRIRVTPVK